MKRSGPGVGKMDWTTTFDFVVKLYDHSFVDCLQETRHSSLRSRNVNVHCMYLYKVLDQLGKLRRGAEHCSRGGKVRGEKLRAQLEALSCPSTPHVPCSALPSAFHLVLYFCMRTPPPLGEEQRASAPPSCGRGNAQL